MKICLYLEYYHLFGGILFKKIGTGLLTSYQNQKKMLAGSGIEYSEQWDGHCDILQINTPWLRSLYLMKQARRRHTKIIIWAHVTAEDAKMVFRFAPAFIPLLKKYLIYAYGLADKVFCPSVYTKGLLEKYGLPPDNLTVMSNGVDPRIFYPDAVKRREYRERFGLKRLTVGMVGLVIPRKGTEDFIALAGKFPQCDFIWYGKAYNRLMAEGPGRDLPGNVKFTGYVEDANAAFNSLDIFLFPSYEENQGMAVLEAAAAGLPVIVRDIPVYRGWLEPGVNCLKARNIGEFENGIRSLLDNEGMRAELGRQAARLAEAESIDKLRAGLVECYQALLNKEK